MNQPTQAVTDVPEFITDLDGGQFDRALSFRTQRTQSRPTNTREPAHMTPIYPATFTERRPSDWWQSMLVVLFECSVMFALGYLSRPILERWLT